LNEFSVGFRKETKMKTKRLKFMAVPAGLAAVAASLVVPSGVAHAGECGGGGNPISVAVPQEVPGQFGQKLTAVSHPSSDSLATSIPAGTYSALHGSYDPAHPQTPDQANERWYAVFSGPGGVVGQTALTPDLPNSVTSATFNGGTIVLTGNATSVKYFHGGGGDGVESIYPASLVLTPNGQYPPQPCGKKDDDGGKKDDGGGKKDDGGKKDAPKTEGPKGDVKVEVKAEGPAAASAVIPVVAGSAASATPVAAAAAPAAAAPAAAAPAAAAPAAAKTVEVKGIQVENAAPAAVADVAAAEVAFTGAQSGAMVAAAAGMIGLGAFAVAAARKRKTAK
jgi:hypothetical protein